MESLGNCSQSTHTRSLGNINRSKRCLPTHPDLSRSSKVASFPYQRSGICLPLPSFWPFYCPKSFYSGSESCRSIPPSTRSPRSIFIWTTGFITSQSLVMAHRHTDLVLRTLARLGFIVNLKKSHLQPTQSPIFLGA